MSTVTDPIGNTDKAITQYEFFKSILSFYAGDAATDSYIATQAANLVSQAGVGNFSTDNGNTYLPDKCLVNFNISDTNYWSILAKTYSIPLTGSVFDLTTVSPWVNTSGSKKKLAVGNETTTPFDSMVAYHDLLAKNFKINFDISADGGLIETRPTIKVNGFKLCTGSSSAQTTLHTIWSGTSSNSIGDGGTISVTPQHLYLNKTFNNPLYLNCSISVNPWIYEDEEVSITETYAINGNISITAYKTGGGSIQDTIGPLASGFRTAVTFHDYIGHSTSASMAKFSGTTLPSAITLTIPIVRNIQWAVFDLSRLSGKPIHNASYIFGTDSLNNKVINLYTSNGKLFDSCLVCYLEGLPGRDINIFHEAGYSYTRVNYETWGYDSLAYVPINKVKSDANNDYPVLSLPNGGFVVSTGIFSEGESTPDLLTWGDIKDEVGNSFKKRYYFDYDNLYFYRNLYIQNQTEFSFYVDNTIVSARETVEHVCGPDFTITINGQQQAGTFYLRAGNQEYSIYLTSTYVSSIYWRDFPYGAPYLAIQIGSSVDNS